MTQDEIIEMARQAGITVEAGGRSYEQLLRIINAFAKLIAQHEHQALCQAMEDQITWDMYDPAATAIEVIRARGSNA